MNLLFSHSTKSEHDRQSVNICLIKIARLRSHMAGRCSNESPENTAIKPGERSLEQLKYGVLI